MNLQENLNRIRGLMNLQEQGQIPLLTVLANPAKVGFSTDDGKIIKLNLRDEQGKIVPGSTYSYKVTGKYGLLGFDARFRNIVRRPNGDLVLDAQPTGWVAQKLVGLVPKENRTQDGWIMIKVTNQQLTDAINQLKNKGGKTATIDTGQVDIEIEKI